MLERIIRFGVGGLSVFGEWCYAFRGIILRIALVETLRPLLGSASSIVGDEGANAKIPREVLGLSC